MSARFRVGECEGYTIALPVAVQHGSTSRTPGLSVVVTDTLVCHRVVREWRTPLYSGGKPQTWHRERIRMEARALAYELNAEHEAFLAERAA